MNKKTKGAKRKKMKIKLFFGIIFTYILLIGCEDVQTHNSNLYLEIDAPGLVKVDGYYMLSLTDEYHQTISVLRAQTGSYSEPQKLEWAANRQIIVNNISTDIVNSTSYTDDIGEAFTVLGVVNDLVYDTITVYCGYNDGYSNFIDSLKVIVEPLVYTYGD